MRSANSRRDPRKREDPSKGEDPLKREDPLKGENPAGRIVSFDQAYRYFWRRSYTLSDHKHSRAVIPQMGGRNGNKRSSGGAAV
ncbi:hypothetical protein POVCU2_0004090 [Plasmodium ovale curtisi]|uniref:Uncharacterized protein n=1 Tax=Plasmodium ovale curtisi TaxID=864141 RepID=A0A1A8VN70_PLAOA|nr:hypothetical protein POVCU2_0004090 [Plasmodium ovale curtisi]SBS80917.1 hypothetical protein POVCU1_003680 [Plasmodium ovale curtisi]